jgi:hypothetical protein
VPERLDQEAYQRRLDRLSEIFGSMMETVEDLSGKRCPYKNKNGYCTAHFGCRNQRKPPVEDPTAPIAHRGKRFLCGGDDKLDYRSAWEVD